MLDPHAILAQVSCNEAREEWLVRRAKNEARKAAIIVGILVAIYVLPVLTLFTLIIASGGSAFKFVPLLLHAPWLVLPALLLSAALVYTAWRSEKNKGNAVLILLPEGIVECERWSHERQRRIKSFEYANLAEVTLNVTGGNISFRFPHVSKLHVEDCIPQIHHGYLVLELTYRDGRHEKWPIADKYLSWPEDILVQRLITGCALCSTDPGGVGHFKFTTNVHRTTTRLNDR